MCERRKLDIIGGVNAQRLGERLWRICLATVGECFGQRSEICIEHALDHRIVLRRTLFGLKRHSGHSLKHGHHLAVVVARRIIVDT